MNVYWTKRFPAGMSFTSKVHWAPRAKGTDLERGGFETACSQYAPDLSTTNATITPTDLPITCRYCAKALERSQGRR